MPGGEQSGTQAEGSEAGTETQPTWDTQPPGGAVGDEQSGQAPGGAAGGETDGQPAGGGPEGSWESSLPGAGSDGWETSNQLPGTDASRVPPMPSERGLPPGQGSGDPAEGAQPGGSGPDSELDKALEDFDGEILAERAVIQARSNERAGTAAAASQLPSSGSASGRSDPPGDPGGTAQEQAVYEPSGMPSQKSARRTPPMSAPAGSVPEDIPDARDDDIIARQLREAAMNETDPELREKLWEEYRRYKGA